MKLSILLLVGALQFGMLHAQEPTLAPHQHAPIIIHERHDHTVDSTNWSGYAVTGSNVTDVKGSWTVPSVVCPGGSQYSSFWVGIDGYDSNTVEQLGTDSDCQNGTPTYYMWWEFYPHPSYTLTNFIVKPGDTISAEVKYNGKEFTVTIDDLTQHESYQTSSKVASAKRSSAEWIVEAPYSGGILPLANFTTSTNPDNNTAYFGVTYGKSTYLNEATIGSLTQAIGLFPANDIEQINMVDSSDSAKDYTSVLSTSDQSAFSVLWVSSN